MGQRGDSWACAFLEKKESEAAKLGMDVKVRACGTPCQTEGELLRQRWEHQPATRERGAHAKVVCTLCWLYGAIRESWGAVCRSWSWKSECRVSPQALQSPTASEDPWAGKGALASSRALL